MSAKLILLGNYILSKEVIDKFEPETLLEALPAKSKGYIKDGNYLYYGSGTLDSPKPGDVRISYLYLPSDAKVSIIAGQYGNHLEPFRSKVGKIVMVGNGVQSPNDLIKKFEMNIDLLTYLLRFVGFGIVWQSVSVLFAPIRRMLYFCKLGIFAEKISKKLEFPIALCVTSLIIAIAWALYNLMVTICLIGVIVVVCYFIIKEHSKNEITFEEEQNL